MDEKPGDSIRTTYLKRTYAMSNEEDIDAEVCRLAKRKKMEKDDGSESEVIHKILPEQED